MKDMVEQAHNNDEIEKNFKKSGGNNNAAMMKHWKKLKKQWKRRFIQNQAMNVKACAHVSFSWWYWMLQLQMQSCSKMHLDKLDQNENEIELK